MPSMFKKMLLILNPANLWLLSSRVNASSTTVLKFVDSTLQMTLYANFQTETEIVLS